MHIPGYISYGPFIDGMILGYTLGLGIPVLFRSLFNLVAEKSGDLKPADPKRKEWYTGPFYVPGPYRSGYLAPLAPSNMKVSVKTGRTSFKDHVLPPIVPPNSPTSESISGPSEFRV
jgi:hypothetical protein